MKTLKVELNEEEIEVLLAALPASWTEEGQHQKMIKLKNKLSGIDNSKKA